MQIACAHVLTAFYALSHKVSLTFGEVQHLEKRGKALSPALWQETKETLALADRGGAGTELDLGFVLPIFEWLGIPDEAAFMDRACERNGVLS